MKKFIIAIGILISILLVFFIAFGKVEKNPSQNTLPIKDSEFYKKFYNKNDAFLVGVWSNGSKKILQDNPKLMLFIGNNRLKFLSLSTSKDTLKIKNILSNDSLLKKNDISIRDFYAMTSIFELIGFKKNKEKDVVKINFDVTPYFAVLKNKKIYYQSNAIDTIEVMKILKKIENE